MEAVSSHVAAQVRARWTDCPRFKGFCLDFLALVRCWAPSPHQSWTMLAFSSSHGLSVRLVGWNGLRGSSNFRCLTVSTPCPRRRACRCSVWMSGAPLESIRRNLDKFLLQSIGGVRGIEWITGGYVLVALYFLVRQLVSGWRTAQAQLAEEENQAALAVASGKLSNAVSKLMERRNLSEVESSEAIDALLIAPEETSFQASAFLTLLKAKGETASELAGMARAMRRRATSVNPQVSESLLDIVGTGGDGANTLNISTAAAVLAAAAGARVAKHGNRSSTSMCGSADVLETFGVKIDMSAHGVARCVEDVGIGFMFAPAFHPAMKNLKKVRRGLKFRTAFNILGPLLNPAFAQRQVIGVYSEEIIDKMAEAVYALGTEKSWVIHCSGLDELSPIGPATICEVTPAGIRKFHLDPQDYSIPRCTIEDLRGGDAAYNAKALRVILGGAPGAASNAVILNAAAGLVVADLQPNFREAVEAATRTLKSGAALNLIEKWAKLSQKLK